MAKDGPEYTFSVVIDTDEGESDLRQVLRTVELEFYDVNFDLKTCGKQLVPTEVFIDVGITVVSTLTAEVTLRMLDRIWEKLKEKKLKLRTAEIDAVQSYAEGYMRSINVADFTLLERLNRGLYVRFTFRDSRKKLHLIDVSTFEPHVLNYRRK